MTEKAAAVLAVVVMLLLGAAHVAYGYWTDRIAVQEEIAVVWPVEVEIQETEGEEPEAEDTESLPDAEAADNADKTEAEQTKNLPETVSVEKREAVQKTEHTGGDTHVPGQTTAAEGDYV